MNDLCSTKILDLTCNNDFSLVVDSALGVPSDAEVVAYVLVTDLVDTELRAVIEDAHAVTGLHGVVVSEPEDLRLGCALGFTVEDDGVANVDVCDVIRCCREAGRS